MLDLIANALDDGSYIDEYIIVAVRSELSKCGFRFVAHGSWGWLAQEEDGSTIVANESASELVAFCYRYYHGTNYEGDLTGPLD